LSATPVNAQDDASMSTPQDFAAEVRTIALEGPDSAPRRDIFIWRPASAPPGPLPVIYMADGWGGLFVAAAGVRKPILEGRMPPVLIVATANGGRERRGGEYMYNARRAEMYQAHERWFLETVIPFAERVAGASPDPSQRVVGGFSRGAAFAIEMAERHPDLFAGVLAHSPSPKRELLIDSRAGRLRWVLTGGRHEGSEASVSQLVTEHAATLRAQGAAVRRCIGDWGHDIPPWRDTSPGSIAWLFGFANPDSVATPLERRSCDSAAG
jgi:enterochelin esterase-like enzyme